MKWIMLWSFRYAMGIILLAIGFHCAYKSKNEHKIADTIFWCTWMIIICELCKKVTLNAIMDSKTS